MASDGPLAKGAFASDRLVEATHVLGDNPVFVVEWQTRRILACNDAVERVFGFSARELIGADTSLLHTSRSSFEAFGVMSEAFMRAGSNAYRCHYRMRRKDGSEFPTENIVQPIHDLDESRVAVVSFVRDLSGSPAQDMPAAEALEHGDPHVLAMDIPGLVFQRVRDAEGRDRYPYVAGRLLSELGGDPAAMRAEPERLFALIDPRDRRMYESAVDATRKSRSGIDMVLRLHSPAGDRIWLRLIARPTELHDGSVVWDGIAIDISREKEAQDHAVWLASHDSLTGLVNRSEFALQLEHQLAVIRRRRGSVALAQVGVRGMLGVNEAHGFAAGDEVLRQLGARLNGALLAGDVAARSHSDIFLVKLDRAAHDSELASAVHAIRCVCREPFELDNGASVRLELSIGIARFPEDARDAESLLLAAALAGGRAHDRPEAAYEFYDSALGSEMRRRFHLESRLRRAIDNGDLEPHYQPQFSLADGRMTGLEALVRWPQEDGSTVSPAEFVRLAEETGLVASMGRLVLQKVVADVARWSAAGRVLVPVAVNCSAQQMRDPGFIETYRREVLDRGFDPSMFHLEITESTLLEDFPRTERTMNELAGMGVRFSIDDFGTGFSSLAYLSQLPFDVLKIDRSFVARITADERQRSIVLALVRMASALDLHVIAEGIETAEQERELRCMRCDGGQGFYYTHAVPAGQIEQWLD